MKRLAVVCLTGVDPGAACPPGLDHQDFARAVAEDVVDVVCGLADVELVIAHTTEFGQLAAAVRWPGSWLLPIGGRSPPGAVTGPDEPIGPSRGANPAGPTGSGKAGGPVERVGPIDVLRAVSTEGFAADVAVAICPDAPDLPGLILAKPFSALGSAGVAVAPADGGGLLALGTRLPPAAWLEGAEVGFDSADPIEALQVRAPRRRDVRATLPWHRLRSPADLVRLDPDLEGFDATRALLSGARR